MCRDTEDPEIFPVFLPCVGEKFPVPESNNSFFHWIEWPCQQGLVTVAIGSTAHCGMSADPPQAPVPSQLWRQLPTLPFFVSLLSWALLSIPELSCSALDLESKLSGSVSTSSYLLLVPLSFQYWMEMLQMQHRYRGKSRSCYRKCCIFSFLRNWGSERVV